MFEAVRIAATGLRHQQMRIDTISDNLANANTMGHKAARLDFKDALYTAGIIPGHPYTPEGDQQKGHGVILSAVTRDFERQGSLIETGHELDFAIAGKGFFELSDAFGNVVYTRAGNFYSAGGEGGMRYLVASNGYYVLDEDGQRIEIPEGTTVVSVLQDGTVYFRGAVDADGQAAETSVRLGMYTFANETGLYSIGNGNYSESEVSGDRMADGVGTIMQGFLEGSNVNLASEFTRMIRTQRAFQLASRALSTADEMEGIANNIRR